MSSGQEQLLALILSAFAVIFIPLLIALIRGIVKWTRVEDKLDELVKDMGQLIKDKDATHEAMLKQMTDDRSVTDRRLRWLEENLWKGRRNAV